MKLSRCVRSDQVTILRNSRGPSASIFHRSRCHCRALMTETVLSGLRSLHRIIAHTSGHVGEEYGDGLIVLHQSNEIDLVT